MDGDQDPKLSEPRVVDAKELDVDDWVLHTEHHVPTFHRIDQRIIQPNGVYLEFMNGETTVLSADDKVLALMQVIER